MTFVANKHFLKPALLKVENLALLTNVTYLKNNSMKSYFFLYFTYKYYFNVTFMCQLDL